MKKTLLAALTLMTLLTLFFGCAQNTYTLPWDQFCTSQEQNAVINLSSEERKTIIDLLNDGEWVEGLADCNANYAFYPQKQTLHYDLQIGVFNDLTRKMHLTLSDPERQQINEILLKYKK